MFHVYAFKGDWVLSVVVHSVAELLRLRERHSAKYGDLTVRILNGR